MSNVHQSRLTVLLMLQRMCPLYLFLVCGMCHMNLEYLEIELDSSNFLGTPSY
jgi:hypothetical protein